LTSGESTGIGVVQVVIPANPVIERLEIAFFFAIMLPLTIVPTKKVLLLYDEAFFPRGTLINTVVSAVPPWQSLDCL
jgi:hypothetical protein